MKTLACLIVLGACASEETATSIWTLEVQASICPTPEQAHDALVKTWGQGGTEINHKSCHVDEIVEAVPHDMRVGQACCYATTCSGELGPSNLLELYDATCLGSACDTINLTDFTAAKAEDDLAMTSLACALSPGPPTPTTQSDLVCTYVVTARYACSSEPG